VRKRFGKVMEITEDNALNMEMRIAQEIIETAAWAYNPPRFYGGKVLLLLSSERPAHVDFVSGWKAVIDSDLHVQFLNFHHRDVMKGDNVKLVADAITSHLASSSERALARSSALPET
jgi:thioesterase domain-containing protein